jgi:RNA polymerase sigma factor (sigma-70 family)
MNTTLLHAVVRVADARTPDADLLARFTRNRDEQAFEELVRRHGPLVWSVCRHLLPHHADAEDAFQAVFLALVRGAGAIRAGEALPAWLHGVAVRVAAKARRSAARRRQREQRAAVPEADRSVPDAAWVALMTAVHEEVQQLPDAERTAFVLCDLEGVRQPDAAARLGWPLGTLSGRLCKARQRLLEQLTRRGIAPGVLAIGGMAGSAGVVPAALVEQVTSFPAAVATATGVSSTVAELARGLVEGATMRTKLLAATLVVAGAIGITGGAMVLSKAGAQTGGGAIGPPTGGGGAGGAQPGGAPPGGTPDGGGFGPRGPVPGDPGAGGFDPRGFRMGGDGPGSGMWAFSGSTQWEYKFVDIKNDRKEFEKVITQHGKDGWEFSGSERFGPDRLGGQDLVLVFKKPKGGAFPFGGGMGLPGGGRGGPGEGFGGFDFGALPGFGGARFGPFGGSEVEAVTLKLRNAAAADVATAVEKAFPKAKMLKVVGEPVSNSIIIVADPTTMKDVRKVIEELEGKIAPDGGRGRPMAPGGGGGRGPGPGGPGPVGPGPGPMGPTGGGPMGMGVGGGAARPAGELKVLTLKHATADDMASVLGQVFPGKATITPDARSNQLIVRTDLDTLAEITKLLEQLDVPVKKK